jgi:4-hydroxy-3-polyprenylbenzoate decarboxylase
VRLIVGITGASGAIYGIRLLEFLRSQPEVESHLVMSEAAKQTIVLETGASPETVAGLADRVYDNGDLAAAISSGSFQTAGMIVAPCSIKSLSAIANSYDDSLLTRAADVCLKERRRLVLMVRETPLHLGHLDLMMRVTRSGAVVLPPCPAFYFGPRNIEQIVDHSIGKALDLLGVEHNLFRRWGGTHTEGVADGNGD